MSQSVRAIAPILSVVDGTPTTTSIEVAQHFGKDHADLLKRIRALVPQLDSEHAGFFSAMLVDTEIGQGATRQDPAYRLTRDGFTLLAMGFTGKKALQFKLAYIAAFNRMERELSSAASKPLAQVAHAAIGPAQAQHIKELVQQVVQATGQGYAEVWGRLHSKFCVNSYLSLSATQFDAVCSYLTAKLHSPAQHNKGEGFTQEEVQALRAMVRSESLESTIARLTEQVSQSNSYPIALFLPLWAVINQRLMQTRTVGLKAVLEQAS